MCAAFSAEHPANALAQVNGHAVTSSAEVRQRLQPTHPNQLVVERYATNGKPASTSSRNGSGTEMAIAAAAAAAVEAEATAAAAKAAAAEREAERDAARTELAEMREAAAEAARKLTGMETERDKYRCATWGPPLGS